MKLKEVKKLLSLQTLQKIQDNYSTALGIPISIRDNQGELLTKLSNASKLWSLIHHKPEAEAKLINLLQQAIDKCYRTGQIVIFERTPDAHAFLAPIHINGKITAFFVGGLVRFGNPNMDIAVKQSEQLGVELDTYLDAYLSLPFITRERLEASANLIKIIGNAISIMEIEGTESKNKTQAIQEKNQQLEKNLENTSKQLTNSKDRYKQLFDTINDGIYVADLQLGTMIEINDAGAKLLGYESPNQMIGKAIKNIYANPAERDQFSQTLLEQGYINNWLARILTPQGQLREFETNATLITDKNTNRQLIQGIFRELSDREHRSIS